MSTPSDLIAEKEKELEMLKLEQAEIEAKALKVIIDNNMDIPEVNKVKEISDENPVFDNDPDTHKYVDYNPTTEKITPSVETEMPSHSFDTKVDVTSENTVSSLIKDFETEEDQYPKNVFIGANCPKCNVMLYRNNLVEDISSINLAFYKCTDDGYIALRSHIISS